MASLKFFYNNLWDVETITAFSEHSNFLPANTQHRDFNKPWRSRYGAGSGWGNFTITAANNKLYFKDNGGTSRTATLTPATYNVDSLLPQIKAAMEATPTTDTFTVEYVEAGDPDHINKFKITDDVGIFELSCTVVTNQIWTTIGYLTGVDRTGQASYLANYVRIHTHEYLRFTRATNLSIYAAIIRGHNFQAGASVTLVASNDDFATTAWSDTFPANADLTILEYDTVKTYQDWQVYIVDINNPDAYVEVGRIFLGSHFQPTKHFAYKRIITNTDPSIIKESEDGQITSIQRSHFKTWQYQFLGTNQRSSFDAMFADRGFSKSLFICEDPDTPLTTTYYVRFVDWSWEHIYDSYYNLTLTVREER